MIGERTWETLAVRESEGQPYTEPPLRWRIASDTLKRTKNRRTWFVADIRKRKIGHWVYDRLHQNVGLNDIRREILRYYRGWGRKNLYSRTTLRDLAVHHQLGWPKLSTFDVRKEYRDHVYMAEFVVRGSLDEQAEAA